MTALFSVAQAYDVSFSALFAPEPEAQSSVVIRADDELIQRDNGLLYSKLSSGNWTVNLRPLRVVVPADREEETLYQHEGEQWLYVRSLRPAVPGGSKTLEVADEENVLELGDAAHLDASNPHKLAAQGGEDAEVILVACAVPYLLLKSYL